MHITEYSQLIDHSWGLYIVDGKYTDIDGRGEGRNRKQGSSKRLLNFWFVRLLNFWFVKLKLFYP